VVVVKRFADALADGDTVRAVIRGTAINNDGAQKAGYTAPSVVGQAPAIAEAMAMGQASPDTINCRGPRHRHRDRRSHRDRGSDPVPKLPEVGRIGGGGRHQEEPGKPGRGVRRLTLSRFRMLRDREA